VGPALHPLPPPFATLASPSSFLPHLKMAFSLPCPPATLSQMCQRFFHSERALLGHRTGFFRTPSCSFKLSLFLMLARLLRRLCPPYSRLPHVKTFEPKIFSPSFFLFLSVLSGFRPFGTSRIVVPFFSPPLSRVVRQLSS